MIEAMTREWAEKTIELIDKGYTIGRVAKLQYVTKSCLQSRLMVYKERYGLSPKQRYRRYSDADIKIAANMR